MKKTLLILLLLSSSLAINLDMEGVDCGGQIIYGILENDFAYDITINQTKCFLTVGGADFCFASEKETVGADGHTRLFSTTNVQLDNGTTVTGVIETVETVYKEEKINFTKCSCQIEFPERIDVNYFPPGSLTNPGKVKITGKFIQCNQVPKLIAVLTIDNKCVEVGSIMGLNPFTYVSQKTYTPEQAKNMKVTVYAWEELENVFGFETKSRVDFPAFSVETRPGPPAEMGGETWVSVSIENTGTLSDDYTISLDVPEAWGAAERRTRTLQPGESTTSNITVYLPPDFKGAEQVGVNVIPMTTSADPINTQEKVETVKIINIETIVDVPPLVKVGKNFTTDVVITSSSTHPSDLYYYLYTEPASRIKPVVGRISLEADDRKNIKLYGEILESCGVDEEKTQLFALLEDIRALSDLLYDEVIKKEPDLEVLDAGATEIEDVLPSLIPTEAYSEISRLSGQIQKVIEAYEEGSDPTRDKETLAFTLDALNEKIDAAEVELLEECEPTDNYKIKLVLTRLPDLLRFYGEDSCKVSIEDVFRVEFPKEELRLQAGKSGTFKLLVYNVGETRRSFEIRASGLTSDWVRGTETFSLDPGYSRTAELRVRPPRMLSGEFELNLQINSHPYSMSKTIPVFIGKYGVEVHTPELDQLEPGEEKTFQLVISNKGEVKDEYRIKVDGENWISYQDNVTLAGNTDYRMNVTLKPPSDASGSYYFEFEVSSIDYPSISDSEKMEVEVSSEEKEVRMTLEDLRSEVNSLYEEYGESQEVNQIYSVLTSAESSLASGNIDLAKTRARQVGELLSDFRANPPQQTPWLLYAMVVIVPLAGYGIATVYMKKNKEKDKSKYGSISQLGGDYHPIRRAPPPKKYRRFH